MLSILVGVLLGFLSGLGIGGGSLLVLWLSNLTEAAPEEIRLINLLFFLPCAAGASWIRLKNQALPWKKMLPLAGIGCIGAIIGCILSRYLPVKMLKKVFGVLILYTGFGEVKKGLQRLRKAR